MFKIYDGRKHFFQWDLDRQLIVEDATIKEVHFCNCMDEQALVLDTYVMDGLTVIQILPIVDPMHVIQIEFLGKIVFF